MRCSRWHLACVLLAACAGHRWALRDGDDSGQPPPAAFLQQPTATWWDAWQELGAPHREFARDRVSMWEMAVEGERCVPAATLPARPQTADYMLVVEFGADRRVRHWSLVTQAVRR